MKCPKCKKSYLRKYDVNFGKKDNKQLYTSYIHKEHINKFIGCNQIDKSCDVKKHGGQDNDKQRT